MFRVTGHKMNDYRNAMLALRFVTGLRGWGTPAARLPCSGGSPWWQSVLQRRCREVGGSRVADADMDTDRDTVTEAKAGIDCGGGGGEMTSWAITGIQEQTPTKSVLR